MILIIMKIIANNLNDIKIMKMTYNNDAMVIIITQCNENIHDNYNNNNNNNLVVKERSISQFTVAVWAWADKGHCRTNFEIHGDKILDTCSWKLCNIIHSCTFSTLHGTQVEVFFEKGEQRLFIKHLRRCRSDCFKLYKVGSLHVLKICGYSGSLQ